MPHAPGSASLKARKTQGTTREEGPRPPIVGGETCIKVVRAWRAFTGLKFGLDIWGVGQVSGGSKRPVQVGRAYRRG